MQPLGTLTKQTALLNMNQNERERVSKLLLLYASEIEEVDALPFGSVGVILGLKNTRTGDTLVSAHGNKASREGSSLPTIVPPPPVMSASIIPQSHSDLDPVQAALQALARTDPSVRVDNHEGQILIHGLGALHLEIVEGRLRDEWNVRFESGRRRVNFREGPGSHKCSPEMSTHNHEIGGQLVAVSIHLDLRPLGPEERGDPAWDGNVVLDAQGRPFLSPESYGPTDPQGQIARGLASALSCSPHTSLPMSHLHVKVLEARYPSVDGASSLLVSASSNALRSALHEAGMGPLMEPYIWLKVTVPENSLGKVVKDLTETGGEVISLTSESNAMIDGTDGVGGFPQHDVYVPPEWLSPSASSGSITNASARMKQTINVLAPLSRMLDYSNRLRALSGGHGLFETANAGFREVSETRKKQILQEIGRA
jgi:elongation factor G